ncbi:hypothetical protein [Saccharibacillus alkalitolerans]|uniref:Uncharacterized protein n=1 Tax=Saccharibacillus alkalitolerans TaxID=2705290 RepID=A0ABX0F7P4_9BACL|nr:hypothetical protein [Saccharibacillus alkalitolerans]NGZ76973.1 hypothetical protein [Saccharibacillus alkalitolerans]
MTRLLLQVAPAGSFVPFIPPLRRATGLGMAELKRRLETGEPLLAFDSFDEERSGEIDGIIRKIRALGGEVRLLDDEEGEELTLEHWRNLRRRNARIGRELADMDDMELTRVAAVLPAEACAIGKALPGNWRFEKETNRLIAEFDFDEELMNLLRRLTEEEFGAKLYQIDREEISFAEEDEVTAAGLLERYGAYFDGEG